MRCLHREVPLPACGRRWHGPNSQHAGNHCHGGGCRWGQQHCWKAYRQVRDCWAESGKPGSETNKRTRRGVILSGTWQNDDADSALSTCSMASMSVMVFPVPGGPNSTYGRGRHSPARILFTASLWGGFRTGLKKCPMLGTGLDGTLPSRKEYTGGSKVLNVIQYEQVKVFTK